MPGFERLGVEREDLARLCVEFGVIELAAFGSVLRDDFAEDSDVDLLVDFAQRSMRPDELYLRDLLAARGNCPLPRRRRR